MTLVRVIHSALHDKRAAEGITAFRGVARFGADGEVYADDMLRLNVDLPSVVEFFDEPRAAEAAIDLLEGRVPHGHVVSCQPNTIAPRQRLQAADLRN